MPAQTLWSRPSALLAALLVAVEFLQGGQGALAAADAEAAPDKKPSWDVNKPPGTARTVTLDTRTGTWMSVDVSPDGKSLVFDLLGDLSLLPIAGGEAGLEALRTATMNPARYLGLERDIGSLEVGKLADLVIIDGDVLSDIRRSDRISHVMQNGRLFELRTMNEVVSRSRARKPFFFEGADGRAMPVDGRGHGEDVD